MGGSIHSTGAITDVPVIEVGHYTNRSSATGCTVVMSRRGAVAAADVRGGAPGTRETDLLQPGNLVDRVHAVLLSGGSSFGLEASAGVMKYLEEQGIGCKIGPSLVPIVPAAILYDLGLVTDQVRPGAAEGYSACLACSDSEVEEGSAGAGTGATVGKALGMNHAVKGGVGTASLDLGAGVFLGAIVAVNAYGGIVDHHTSSLVAGPRTEDGRGFHDSVDLLLADRTSAPASPGTNTSIGVVATNAPLTKDDAHYLARVSHDGLALTIRPCHTIYDGDTVFALGTESDQMSRRRMKPYELARLGAAAVEVVARSVLRAIRSADCLGGAPSIKELGHG